MLTDREVQLIALSIEGLDVEQIAEQMGITANGVWTYRSRIQRKLNLPDFTAVRLWASPVTDQFLQRILGNLKTVDGRVLNTQIHPVTPSSR